MPGSWATGHQTSGSPATGYQTSESPVTGVRFANVYPADGYTGLNQLQIAEVSDWETMDLGLEGLMDLPLILRLPEREDHSDCVV
ncbi:hypothetical protein J6590_067286 [Homalodisca vitripennis]|nr:hypothetical protein J6590_067286 [Homalodisca vitripennis]